MLLFIKVMMTEFIAEMGDKTQLMLVALTSKFKIRDIILGTAAAILVLNGLAVLAGGLVSSLVPEYLMKLVAAGAFLFFALTSLTGDDEEEELSLEDGEDHAGGKAGLFSRLKNSAATVTVFLTFFVAEMGDKTQLTAMTFGASEGLERALLVWLACSVGLFAADIIGMLVGLFIGNKMPEGFLEKLAFVIFAIFGITTLRQGLMMMDQAVFNGGWAGNVMPVTLGVAVVFAAVCLVLVFKGRKR